MSPTLLSLQGEYCSTCGYCGSEPGKRSSSKSSHSYGVYPLYGGISCDVYMAMIDRGWRRSGTFLYKPTMETTCCPQYTIRLEALQFAPSRSQRQVTNRWNRFILEGDKKDDEMDIEDSRKNKTKGKGKAPAFHLVTAIHSSETSFLTDDKSEPAHRFEVTLEASEFTQEKFRLYQTYQHDIHKEEKEYSHRMFYNFLVDSPLREETIPYPKPPPSHLPKHFGSYHQCYRVDGELIAVAVLDILPRCVSSVYFMYNSKWERFSLGKVSAVREAALSREIHDAGITSMAYLYMGYYVHTCQKMRYKCDYSPSYLLDPEEYTWFPFKECMPLLNKTRYACFSCPEKSHDEVRKSEEDLDNIPSEALENVYVLEYFDPSTGTANISSVNNSLRYQIPETKEVILRAIKLLGIPAAEEVIFCLDE